MEYWQEDEGVTWLLEMWMPLLVISSSLCVSKLVRASSPEGIKQETGGNLKSSPQSKNKDRRKVERTEQLRHTVQPSDNTTESLHMCVISIRADF